MQRRDWIISIAVSLILSVVALSSGLAEQFLGKPKGQIYFVVDNLGDFKLVRMPADCLFKSAPCPEPQEISGYYPGSLIAPLL